MAWKQLNFLEEAMDKLFEKDTAIKSSQISAHGQNWFFIIEVTIQTQTQNNLSDTRYA